MSIQKISENDIARASMEGVANRPNDRTGFGNSGMTPQQLKERHSALPKLAIRKLNEVIEAFGNEESEGDLLSALYLALEDEHDMSKKMTLAAWIARTEQLLVKASPLDAGKILTADEKGRAVWRDPSDIAYKDHFFTIVRSFESVDEMNASYPTDDVPVGALVIIDTGSTEDEDTGKIYYKGLSGYVYRADLSGPKGKTGEQGGIGPDGLSAYDVALKNGFEGTEEEWLASLKGADGKDGQDGADGKDGEGYTLTDADKEAIGKAALETQKGVWGGVVPMPDAAPGVNNYVPSFNKNGGFVYRAITFGTPHYGNLAGYDGTHCIVTETATKDKHCVNFKQMKDHVDSKFADEEFLASLKGAPGEDYVLTDADKAEIAKLAAEANTYQKFFWGYGDIAATFPRTGSNSITNGTTFLSYGTSLIALLSYVRVGEKCGFLNIECTIPESTNSAIYQMFSLEKIGNRLGLSFKTPTVNCEIRGFYEIADGTDFGYGKCVYLMTPSTSLSPITKGTLELGRFYTAGGNMGGFDITVYSGKKLYLRNIYLEED